MRIAAIADVHGNRWALEAVLADLERRGVATVVDLGDAVYGPLDPGGTADLLMRSGVVGVSGNQDRAVAAPERDDDPETLRFTRSALRPEHVAWLAALPRVHVALGLVCRCHGTPARDDEYLLETVTSEGASARDPAEVAALVANVGQPVVACGHSHRARTLELPGGRIVLNPGSVGLPAYSDDAPHPHVMAAGSPHARYALLECSARGWRVEPVTVRYDWDAAARAAARHGRPDWAQWLRTGRAAVPVPKEAS